MGRQVNDVLSHIRTTILKFRALERRLKTDPEFRASICNDKVSAEVRYLITAAELIHNTMRPLPVPERVKTSITALKAMARYRLIPHYSRMSKVELISALTRKGVNLDG